VWRGAKVVGNGWEGGGDVEPALVAATADVPAANHDAVIARRARVDAWALALGSPALAIGGLVAFGSVEANHPGAERAFPAIALGVPALGVATLFGLSYLLGSEVPSHVDRAVATYNAVHPDGCPDTVPRERGGAIGPSGHSAASIAGETQPADDRPPLRIEPTDPRDHVYLYRLIPTGWVVRRGRRRTLYDRELVCGPVCQFRPDHPDLFEVTGPGFMPSDSFVLRPDTKAVHVSMGSKAAVIAGLVLYIPGSAAIFLVDPAALGCALDGARERYCRPLMIGGIASVVATVGGLALILHNLTKVRVSPPD
jgi:hypothetical protein